MFKPTPNPPETDSCKSGTMYAISPDIDNEALLANACETLTSAKVMANDFAGFLNGSQRHRFWLVNRDTAPASPPDAV